MRPISGVFGSFAVAATLLVTGSAAYGQGYSTNFDKISGFQSGYTLSDQNGWVTNDEASDPPAATTTGETIGQSDYVGAVAGFSTNLTSDYQGEVGGLFQGSTVPGASSVFLYHPFTLGATTAYAFNVDMDIQRSQSPDATNDSFGWTFRNNAGTTVFSIDFVPTTTMASGNTTTTYALRYTVPGAVGGLNGGSQFSTGDGFFSDKAYHLSVSVGLASFSFAVTSGATSIGENNVLLLTNAGASVTQVAATWNIADNTTDNGGYVNAGTNTLVFDNYAITVPEPSTWVAAGIGGLALMLAVRRRSRA